MQSNINFDLIFLDDFTFDQTLRDFISSLALCHPNTIWLIDDTVPTDAIAADPNLNKVREARSIINKSDDETWMVMCINNCLYRLLFPQYTCLH